MRVRGLLTALLVLAACEGDGASADLSGGVLATFEVGGETFRAFVTNPNTIQQLFDLRDGLSEANIPVGTLRTGPGVADHNLPWSWHLDPVEIQMAELAIEACDGTPSIVENDLAGYLALGSFCPWSATLVALEDLR
jgi:hypothetical protein